MRKLFALLFISTLVKVTSAQDYTLSLNHGGKERTFILHSPCGTFNCAGKKIPLVFAFHGLTETGTAIKNYSEFNAVADTAGFAVIYANGIQNRWNVGFPGTGASGEDDLGFANAMIDYMIANASRCDSNICAEIDTNRIYSCGMSNGGFFSYLLACKLSHRIAAIASVTGSMTAATFDSCNPSRQVPVFQLHGTSDNIVPYAGGGQSGSKSVDEVLAYWVNQNGCTGNAMKTNLPDVNSNDGCTVESYHWNNCANGSEVLHYKIIGGGHTWPAMNAQYPEIIVGKTNRDVHGSQEIWRFFSRHSLLGASTSLEEFDRADGFRFFPNPANDVLNVDAALGASLSVYDLSGKEVLAAMLTQGINSVSLSDVAKGFYLAKIETGKTSHFARILKQ